MRALNLNYPEAWLSNDPDRVMETFAEDAVLMVMKRDVESGWRIARYIWNHPPWELHTAAD